MQAAPVTSTDTTSVTGISQGIMVIELLKTFIDTACANQNPRIDPIRPPQAPRTTPSPMNSLRILSSDAPRAFRRPISLRLSATTAVIVVATQIIVSIRTTTVTRRTSACSLESTVVSDWVTLLTNLALMEGTVAEMFSA